MKWFLPKTAMRAPRDFSTGHGFTLIELLVSVGLFTVVMTISVGTLLALINANQKAQSLKSVVNNLNFGLDSMLRTIRTGRVYNCMTGQSILDTLPSGVANCANGKSGLVLTDDHGNRLAYKYDNVSKRIYRRDIASGTTWIALTAPEVVIEDMLFYVTGTGVGDTLQPTVTVNIRGHMGLKESTDSSFNIETSVTQRVLDE